MCVGKKKIIVIGYFRKCIPYSGLVVLDKFGIVRGDTSNENRFVKHFPKKLKERVETILKTNELLTHGNIYYIYNYLCARSSDRAV